MLQTYKDLIARQYEAALCMLGACVDRCPDENWRGPVATWKFCQAVFHVLFFTDVYLGPDLESIYQQPFHREHADIFADYEEIGGGLQQATYEKPFIRAYLAHCRRKAAESIAAETEDSLHQTANFDWLHLIRAELHVYNIRHIQHHAAQLSLRLRLDAGEDIPWVGSGWRELTP